MYSRRMINLLPLCTHIVWLQHKDMNLLPPITKNLLIINILFFFGTFVAEKHGVNLTDTLGLHFVLASDFRPYQLLTYMFMHSGFSHLFFNMFAVYMFGGLLEQTWGSRRFLLYYIICGVGAGLVQEAVQYIEYATQLSHYTQVNTGNSIISMAEYLNLINTVGASGAVYAILLGFGMMFPNHSLFVFPLPVPIKAKFFVMGYAAIELLTGIANRPGDTMAHFAHLGGMVFGFILIKIWTNHARKKRNETVSF